MKLFKRVDTKLNRSYYIFASLVLIIEIAYRVANPSFSYLLTIRGIALGLLILISLAMIIERVIKKETDYVTNLALITLFSLLILLNP